MIFVTVGTHEQPFNRLIQEVDRLKRENIIKDEVQMQTGILHLSAAILEWKAFFHMRKCRNS